MGSTGAARAIGGAGNIRANTQHQQLLKMILDVMLQ